jgi:hypothetical protein
VLLLLRFPAAASSQVVGRGGAPLVQCGSGEAGYGEAEREGVSGDVWEVAGEEVRCFASSEGVYIGRGDGNTRGQKLTVAGALAALRARSGHGVHARVLGGRWVGRGVLWVSSGAFQTVGIARDSRFLGGGPGCVSPSPSSSHGLGRRWGGWARPRHRPASWLQHRSELEQCSTVKFDSI